MADPVTIVAESLAKRTLSVLPTTTDAIVALQIAAASVVLASEKSPDSTTTKREAWLESCRTIADAAFPEDRPDGGHKCSRTLAFASHLGMNSGGCSSSLEL